jgi:ABC-type Fe3+-siderophore transport system permease subunit
VKPIINSRTLTIAGWASLFVVAVNLATDPGNLPVPFVVFGAVCGVVCGIFLLYFAAKLRDRSDSDS